MLKTKNYQFCLPTFHSTALYLPERELYKLVGFEWTGRRRKTGKEKCLACSRIAHGYLLRRICNPSVRTDDGSPRCGSLPNRAESAVLSGISAAA